jgi:2-polyprenyl-3-methyl-5-hydroxy-6-metoxy-1,4-benzoquinol methylase
MIAARHRLPELMDQPELDPRLHVAALAGLRRINAISRSASILWPSIAEAAQQVAPQPLRVLDLACGSGDNILAIHRKAKEAGIKIQVHGCDISAVAVTEARRAAEQNGVDTAQFFTHDVLAQPLPRGYHVITCSLFLHHLSQADAVQLVRNMAGATERSVLVCDLRRTWLGMGLAWAASRVFTRSQVVHTDAVRSVAAAFVENEITALASECEISNYVISQHWPQRSLLWWSKQDAQLNPAGFAQVNTIADE